MLEDLAVRRLVADSVTATALLSFYLRKQKFTKCLHAGVLILKFKGKD